MPRCSRPLSEALDADSPEVVARLEALDDAVFDAIQGKAAALADLHQLWPALKIGLGEALLAESREQYIRYALSLWREPANIAENQGPARASTLWKCCACSSTRCGRLSARFAQPSDGDLLALQVLWLCLNVRIRRAGSEK